MISERQEKLLKLIIEDYIKTARPIGSKSISGLIICSKDFSPASALASTEFRTSYGREATSLAISFGGRTPANGLIFITFPFVCLYDDVDYITKKILFHN